MHFTLILNSHESHDVSYGLVFTPCAVWTKGDAELIRLHPANPHYQRGDFQELLRHERPNEKLAPGLKQAIVVQHTTGHGTVGYLDDLHADLVAEGFEVRMLAFGPDDSPTPF